MRSARLNVAIYGANILFLIFALATLLWLKRRFESELGSTIDATLALFPRSVMGAPDDPGSSFEPWEERARVAEHSQFIKRLIVSKIVSNGDREREVVVYPFTYLAREGKPAPTPEDGFAVYALKDGQGTFGAAYFDLDLAPLNSVRMAGLLFFALLFLTARLRSRDRALTKTTIELQEKQNQLIRLERLSLVGQLTANIFHDIKKPVLHIRHELEDLGETLGNFAGASRGLRNIREQVDLFFAMLRDLNLERFVRSETAEREYVELPKTVEQACRLVEYERGDVETRIHAAPGVPLALAHPYRLIQVFSNLALNAYQAMEGRGELRIDIRRGEEGLIEIRFADTGRLLA